MRVHSVQNVLVVASSVPDEMDRNTSRRARALHQNGYAQSMSKMSLHGVQNVLVVASSVPDGGSEYLSQSESATPEQFCAEHVQDELAWCPKCFVVVPSVSDEMDRNTSRRALHRNGCPE